MKKITPEDVIEIGRNEVFVFGSNERGLHGAGAAWFAHKKCGARLNQGFGFMGQSFAIPTKDWEVQTLPLSAIKFYVDRYIAFAKHTYSRDWKFLTTPIGCGLAGYTPQQIAPFFKECTYMRNMWLPGPFWDILGEPSKQEMEKRKWNGNLLSTMKEDTK